MANVKITDMIGMFTKLRSMFHWTGVITPELSPVVQPVVNAIELGGHDIAIYMVCDLSGTAGTINEMRVVPPGQRFVMIMAAKPSTQAPGTFLVQMNGTYAAMGASGTAADVFDLFGVELYPGDRFGFQNTGDGADNARACQVIFRRYFLDD